MKQIFFLGFIISLLSFPSCSSSGSSDNDEPTGLKPSNLSVTEVKVGEDSSNPNGDGSGTVNFTITATGATYYKVLIDSETLEFTENTFSYTFTQTGTQEYSIIVAAYNSQGSVSITYNITVYIQGESGLVWSDEFNTDGAPNPSNWGYDVSSGPWPDNNELQRYTNNTVVKLDMKVSSAKFFTRVYSADLHKNPYI